MKLLPLIACMSLLTLASSAEVRADEWKDHTDDFSSRTLKVKKGQHTFFAVGTRPLDCVIFRSAGIVKASSDGACLSGFESLEDETITVLIVYHMKGEKQPFSYHALLL